MPTQSSDRRGHTIPTMYQWRELDDLVEVYRTSRSTPAKCSKGHARVAGLADYEVQIGNQAKDRYDAPVELAPHGQVWNIGRIYEASWLRP